MTRNPYPTVKKKSISLDPESDAIVRNTAKEYSHTYTGAIRLIIRQWYELIKNQNKG